MLTAGECPECGPAMIDLYGGDGQFFNDCQDCGHEWIEYQCRYCHEPVDREDKYECPHCGHEGRIYK